MTNRVVPEPEDEAPDPLTLGPKATWAVYVPQALIDAVKHAAKEDRYSASAYAEKLLIYALRVREAERIRDREARRKK